MEGSPTFPKWLLPRHYPGLKLKTGNKKGSHLAEPLKAPPVFLQAGFLLRRRRLGSRGLQPRFRPSPHLAPSATEAVIPWGPKESADAGEREMKAQESESGNGSEAGQRVCGLSRPPGISEPPRPGRTWPGAGPGPGRAVRPGPWNEASRGATQSPQPPLRRSHPPGAPFPPSGKILLISLLIC